MVCVCAVGGRRKVELKRESATHGGGGIVGVREKTGARPICHELLRMNACVWHGKVVVGCVW